MADHPLPVFQVVLCYFSRSVSLSEAERSEEPLRSKTLVLHIMWLWIVQQWNDIKGNVKYALVLIGGAGLITLVTMITHGLLPWQQVVLMACFVLVFGWAAFVTAVNVTNCNFSRCVPVTPRIVPETVRQAFLELPWPAQIAVRIVYAHSGTHIGDLGHMMAERGFRDLSSITETILATNLVRRDFIGYLSPNPDMMQDVVALLEETPVL